MIDGDSTQLQQILVNLCVNARDAMSDGGRIDVTVENVEVDTSMAHMILGARTGSFVLLTVSDTGNGMPADILDKIFEPFFTTKAVGTGTGLGLSTVYNIVKSHSGFVTTYSEVGTGTTFRIYLPSSKSEIIQPDEPALVNDHAGYGRCVLIVDDEPVILEALSEALIDVGYEPIVADGEKKALQVTHKKELSAAIVDMMLAGEDGLSTIEKLLERDPALPVIAISGMGESMSEKASRAGARLFLSKPFTALQLYDALDHALAKNA